MGTMGERIDYLAQEYIAMYERFKSEEDGPFSENPDTMATHDLRMKLYVYKRALEQLEAYIEQNPVNPG